MGSGFEDLPSIAGGSTRFSTLVAASGRVRKDYLPFCRRPPANAFPPLLIIGITPPNRSALCQQEHFLSGFAIRIGN